MALEGAGIVRERADGHAEPRVIPPERMESGMRGDDRVPSRGRRRHRPVGECFMGRGEVLQDHVPVPRRLRDRFVAAGQETSRRRGCDDVIEGRFLASELAEGRVDARALLRPGDRT